MSEQPTTDGQSPAQFDAEAAQRAKDFLNVDVTRNQDGLGAIVDDEGYPIKDDASYHRQMVEETGDRMSTSDERLGLLQDDLDKVKQGQPNQSPFSTTERLESEVRAEGQFNASTKQRHDNEKQAAGAHYQANQAGYVAQAVEDANNAGVDIQLGGHNFPAKPPRQPQPGPEEPQPPAENAA